MFTFSDYILAYCLVCLHVKASPHADYVSILLYCRLYPALTPCNALVLQIVDTIFKMSTEQVNPIVIFL